MFVCRTPYHQGLSYDVEEGSSGLQQAFADSFAAARSAGLKVMVTVSHSSPYGIPDGPKLMAAFFADHNIDYLSPQLYTSGTEAANDFTESAGVPWSAYKGATALFVPSIVDDSMYASAVSYFQAIGITPAGYAQWKQELDLSGKAPIEKPSAGTNKAKTERVKAARTRAVKKVRRCRQLYRGQIWGHWFRRSLPPLKADQYNANALANAS